MDITEKLAALAGISASVFAFVEFLKPYIKIYFAPIDDFDEDTKAAIYRLLNVIFCIGIVLSSDNELNLFSDTEFLGVTLPFLGMILTGLATGLGGTVLNFAAAWATMRFITVPAARAQLLRAEALGVTKNVPGAAARALEVEIKEDLR